MSSSVVTIYDIAKKTGYSPPTISKALNGTGGLSASTRSLILETAKKMGYTPNMNARALTTNRSHLIGVIYEDHYMLKGFKHPLFSDILNNFRKVIENSGYDLLFLSRTLGDRHISYLEHCNYRKVDAILVMNPLPGDKEVQKLSQCGLPIVSANEPIPGICTVVTENVSAAIEAVQYLINLGHRKIAHITGPLQLTAPAARERFEGYRKCLESNGIAFNPALIEESPFWHADGGYEAGKRLLSRTRDFTALFVSNDSLAFGVKKALGEYGLEVPKHVSIIGFDGDESGGYTTPALTTMWQNTEEIGTIAARLLLRQLSGEELKDIIKVPAVLLMRESCKEL